MRMKLRIALATILSLLVASCGGSESDSSQTNGTPADNDSQVTVTTQRKAVLNLSIQTFQNHLVDEVGGLLGRQAGVCDGIADHTFWFH